MQLSSLDLVDVVVAVVVIASVATALRRRSGLLGAVGAGLAALVLSWLVVVALSTWAPTPVAEAADQSRVLRTVPAPQKAVEQARQLVHDVTGHHKPSPENPGESH